MDPDKYKQNADIKADTPLQNLISVISVALMIIGLTGLGMEFFKEDGWIGKFFSFFFKSTGTMLLLPVLIFVLWLLNRWISSPNKGATKKGGNLPMYLMMLAGVYYVYQFTLG